MENTRRKPEWLKIKLPMGQLSVDVLNTIRGHHLNTICTSGRCPNQGECWCGTATFMIGGNICTRACKFCNVTTGHPAPLDPQEPEHVARSIRLLGLKHAVITSVDRDDVEDLGASHWVKVIRAMHTLLSGILLNCWNCMKQTMTLTVATGILLHSLTPSQQEKVLRWTVVNL